MEPLSCDVLASNYTVINGDLYLITDLMVVNGVKPMKLTAHWRLLTENHCV